MTKADFARVASRGTLPKWWWLGAAALVTVTALSTNVLRGLFTPAEPPPREISFRRITDSLDMEENPAVSPQGTEVAFVRAVKGRRQIWIQRDGGGQPLQITDDDIDHDHPRWLPDSSGLIYFTASTNEDGPGSIWRIPTYGGTPRLVTASMSGADVSRDGEIAAFQKTGNVVRLLVLDAQLAVKRTIDVDAGVEHLTPRWSPDARSIAFVVNGVQKTEYVLFVADVASGRTKRLATVLRINGICWLPDNSGVIYASSAGSTATYPPVFHLRVVSADGTFQRQLYSSEDSFVHPDLAASGRLFVSRIRTKSDIWEYPVAGSPNATGRQITDQASHVQTPSVSPDGSELAYLSDSSGHSNVWVMKIDGSNPHQVTFEQDPEISIGLPIWAPRGNEIAFVRFSISGGAEWIADATGLTQPRLLVEGATAAAWSGDAKWVYYQRHSSAVSDIFRKLADGTGGEIQVRRDASMPAISRDGKTMYYSPGHPGNANIIHKASPEDGPGQELARYLPSQIPVWPTSIVVSPDGLWLALPLKEGGTTNIWTIRTADGTRRRITDFGRRATLIARQVAWSPKSDFIYAAVSERNADVLLIDGLDTTVRGRSRR